MSDAHPAHLAHQFDDVEQQRQASTLGMWIFLITEVMFFGGLFAGYTIYRSMYPEAFIVGSHLLSIKWGGLNTVVLLMSSLTMVLAVHSAQTGKRNLTAVWLVATMVLGLTFLGVKVIEYSAKIEHHLVPGPNFHFDPAHVGVEHGSEHAPAVEKGAGHNYLQALEIVKPRNVQLFYSFYFTMTGMHAVHMIIGVGIMLAMLRLTLRNRFSPDYYAPLEISGLYWHFVDIVWIFLFPLLYLVGRH
jgi:cytochrome c oxidase subunit III